jgi:hypothetical protein
MTGCIKIMDVHGYLRYTKINVDRNRYVTGYPRGHRMNHGYQTGYFDWIFAWIIKQI